MCLLQNCIIEMIYRQKKNGKLVISTASTPSVISYRLKEDCDSSTNLFLSLQGTLKGFSQKNRTEN